MNTMSLSVRDRAAQFADRFGMTSSIIMAPMAGACPPALASAVARAGAMGSCGALLDTPERIAAWVGEFRGDSPAMPGDDGYLPLQMNLWIPDPPPPRDEILEASVREFLSNWGPPVALDAFKPDVGPQFEAQVDALIAAQPTVISSIMGLYPDAIVQRFRAAGIAWFACATTVADAVAAEQAGADVIVAQGAEAGGHRGAFIAADGADKAVGLFALLPQVVDAVEIPVVATGGIADARGIVAALTLGASAVQIGTGLLRADESSVSSSWAQAIGDAASDATRLTRAFSGRWGRAIASDYVLAANAADGPEPAPYPIQRALTGAMRKAAVDENDIRRIQAWAGQGARLAPVGPAGQIVARLWSESMDLLDRR